MSVRIPMNGDKRSQETDFETEKSGCHWMRARVFQSLGFFCFIDFLLMVGRKSLPILEEGDSSILERKSQTRQTPTHNP